MPFSAAVVLSLVFAVLTVAAFSWRSRKNLAGIDIALANGALLLDVRSGPEFDEGHLPGAVNIPVQELKARLQELPELDKPIVLYCYSGARTMRAWWILRMAGFEQVLDLGPMSYGEGLSSLRRGED